MPGRTIFADITPRTEGHTVRKLIERAIPYLVTEPYIEAYTIPNKEGRIAKWRRYLALTVATVPLAEGVTPPGQKLTYSDVQVVMEQYGDWVGITDVIEDTHEDPILNDTVENCSEQMAETREINRISVWTAGTSVMYAGDPTYTLRTDVLTALVRADLTYTTRQMKDNKAREISKLMTSNRNYGTEPIAPAFFAFGDSDLDADIYKLPGFVPVEKYTEPGSARVAEIGKWRNIRFVTTSLFDPWADSGGAVAGTGLISTTGADCDIYPLIILARKAVAGVALRGKFAVTPVVVNPGRADHYDKLGQTGHVGWKNWDANVILNDDFIWRIEVGCTLYPA